MPKRKYSLYCESPSRHDGDKDVQVLSWLYEYAVKYQMHNLNIRIEHKCKAKEVQPDFRTGYAIFVRRLQQLAKKDLEKEDLNVLLQLLEDILRLRQFQLQHKFYETLILLYVTVKLLILHNQKINSDVMLTETHCFKWEKMKADFGLVDDTFKDKYEVCVAANYSAIQTYTLKSRSVCFLDEAFLIESKRAIKQKITNLLACLYTVFPHTAIGKIVADKDLPDVLSKQGIRAYKVLIENLKNGATESVMNKILSLLVIKKKKILPLSISDQDDVLKESHSSINKGIANVLSRKYTQLDTVCIDGKEWPMKKAKFHPLNLSKLNEKSKDISAAITSLGSDNSVVSDQSDANKKSPEINKEVGDVKTGNCTGLDSVCIDGKELPVRKAKFNFVKLSNIDLEGRDSSFDESSVGCENLQFLLKNLRKLKKRSNFPGGCRKTVRVSRDSNERVVENKKFHPLNFSRYSGNCASEYLGMTSLVVPNFPENLNDGELETLISELESVLLSLNLKLNKWKQKYSKQEGRTAKREVENSALLHTDEEIFSEVSGTGAPDLSTGYKCVKCNRFRSNFDVNTINRGLELNSEIPCPSGACICSEEELHLCSSRVEKQVEMNISSSKTFIVHQHCKIMLEGEETADVKLVGETKNMEMIESSSKNTETIHSSSKNTETIHSSIKNTETIHSSIKNTETIHSSSKNTETIHSSSMNADALPSSSMNIETIDCSSMNVETKQSSSMNTETMHDAISINNVEVISDTHSNIAENTMEHNPKSPQKTDDNTKKKQENVEVAKGTETNTMTSEYSDDDTSFHTAVESL